MLWDAAGRPVSASMKPLRSLRVLAGGSSSVSSSVSDGVPGAVMDMVTRGLWLRAGVLVVCLSRWHGNGLINSHGGKGAAGSGFLAWMQVFLDRARGVVPCADAEGREVLDGWRGGLGCGLAQAGPRRAITCSR
jgi:hypothetical protein